jgi:hypothetical protein
MKRIRAGSPAEQSLLIQKAIRDSAKMPCTLCGGKPFVGGVFAPYTKKFTQHTGSSPAVVYTLCKKCNKKPDKIQLVEDVILKDLAASSN